MRFSGGGEFLPLTGGALTGPLTISTNNTPALILDRPDGADHAFLSSRSGGTARIVLWNKYALEGLEIKDSGGVTRLTTSMLTGKLTVPGQVRIDTNVQESLIINSPGGVDIAALVVYSAGAPRYAFGSYAAQPRFTLEGATFITRLSLDTVTGLLGASKIPLSLLRVDEQTAQNAIAVTVGAGATTIVNLASVTVAVGDRIVFTAQVIMLKGATAGLTTMQVNKSSGTATIALGVDATVAEDAHEQPNATTHKFTLSGVFQVTGAGTAVITLGGLSAGSNGTVAIGDGDLHAMVLRG